MIDHIRQGRDTPCVGVCNLLYADSCQGCGRTVEEEAFWSVMDEDEKNAVWYRVITELGWKPGKGINAQRAHKGKE